MLANKEAAMAGPMEEAGKVATGFIDALAREPLALALSVICFALIVFMFFQNDSFNDQRKANVQLFVTMQSEVQKLLSQCIVPVPTQR
jgi:hypothetical protein